MLFLFSFIIAGHVLKVEYKAPVPRDIYIAESMAVDHGVFFILDTNSYVLLKIGADKKILKTAGRGEGPGELFNPWAVAASDGRVFVSDYQRIIMYNQKDLKFIKQFRIFNNAMCLTFFKDELFLSTIKFPSEDFCAYVVDLNGKLLRSIYKIDDPHAEEEMKLPRFDQAEDGTLFFLNHQGYKVDITDRKGKTIKKLKLKVPVQYKPVTSFAAIKKKFGDNMASWKRWQSEWSVSSQIAFSRGKVWLCFEELQPDLRDLKYFVEVYDFQSGEKIIPWTEVPGRLYDGGEYAYFIAESGAKPSQNYDLQILGYVVK